jgi:hypothetical protein
MAMLVHEIWEDVGDDGSVLPGLCLAGPDGEAFRKLLHRDARCTVRFEAGSYFEAMTIYYRHHGWGAYTTDFASDREPYLEDRAQRQSFGTN